MAQLEDFAMWLTTPLGQYLTRAETAWFDRTVIDIFGYHALQLGLPQIDCLSKNRMPWRGVASVHPSINKAVLCCEPDFLPFPEQSFDLLVLPHTLDFASRPNAVLCEAERVLRPEGQLLITGFNPWSLWGWKWMPFFSQSISCRNRLSLARLKQELGFLGLACLGGKYLCYNLPIQNTRWLLQTRFLEQAGDRWWPAAGGVYCLNLIKRVKGMRIIEPQWRHLACPKARPAAATEKIHLFSPRFQNDCIQILGNSANTERGEQRSQADHAVQNRILKDNGYILNFR